MWIRGRTVLSLVVLTAVVAAVVTYALTDISGLASLTAPVKDAGKSTDERAWSRRELDKLNKALALIEKEYLLPTDRAALLDGAIEGMVRSLGDPYSVYKTADEAEHFTDVMMGTFTGIGAELRIEDGAIVVEAPIRGSPAERAGLRPLDILLSVNGEELHGLPLSEAIAKIRGPKGTKATLMVQREGADEPLELELVRDRIDLNTVHAELGTDGVGYIRINQFNYETPKHIAESLAELEDGGMKALIVDVRDNPGGILQSVVDVAGHLLPKGSPVVQFEYKDGARKTGIAEPGLEAPKPYPMVVLINEGSASASEILAGALRQSGGAKLVGATTFGKGTVQIGFETELEDGSLIKLSVYKWMLPDGAWINETGLEPDVAVAQPEYFLASLLPREQTLRYDMTGQAVRNLQNILEGVGYSPQRNDGYFDGRTKLELERFQEASDLPVTGETDEPTMLKLEEDLYLKLQDPANDVQRQAALGVVEDLLAR